VRLKELRRRLKRIDDFVAGYGREWRVKSAMLVMKISEATMILMSWLRRTGRYSRDVSGEYRVESVGADISAGRMPVRVISELGWRV